MFSSFSKTGDAHAKKATRSFAPHLLSATALTALVSAAPAFAIEYSYGEVSGSVDTILSAGASMRTSDRNCENIGLSAGGCSEYDATGGRNKAFSNSNVDDGNLNYDQWDVFSGALKATSEVQAGWRNFGAFVRGTAHVDPIVDNVDFRELEGPQRSEVSQNAKLLDYFVTGSFDVGTLPLELKLGNQVISWGESTFIQNGLSAINPIDVAAVRKPGSELKEFFVPILAARASLGLPAGFSIDGFYQFKSDNIVPDPSGTYFSSADFVGRGAQPLRGGSYDFGSDARFNPFTIASGLSNDTVWGGAGGPNTRAVNTPFASIERDNDKNADSGGEFGLALRYFASELNQGTEFGLFFMNLHSRLPILELSTAVPQQATDQLSGTNFGQLGTLLGAAPAGGARNAFEVGQSVCNAFAANGAAALLAFNGVGSANTPFAIAGALSGNPAADIPANIGAVQLALPGGYTNCNNIARMLDGNMSGIDQVTLLTLANTQRFRLHYPEDIQVLGLSVSTTVKGIAVQAEATYRNDQPFNYAFNEMGALANDASGQTAFASRAPQAGGLAPLAGGVPLPIPGIQQQIADPLSLFEARDLTAAHGVAARTGQPTFTQVAAAENAALRAAGQPGFVFANVPTPGLQARANTAAATGNFIPIDPLIAPALRAPTGIPNPIPGLGGVTLANPADLAFVAIPQVGGVPAPAQTRSSVIPLSAIGRDGFIKPKLEDVFTAQTTLTSLLFASNPIVEFARADGGVLVTEFGMVFVPGISSNTGLMAGNTRGYANGLTAQNYRLSLPDSMRQGSGFATEFSWGAQGLVQLTYNRAFGSPINLSPNVAWKWDFGGNTPAPFSNYQAERKAITLGLSGTYLANWAGSLNWTSNFGPDAPLNDRDFASVTVSYAF